MYMYMYNRSKESQTSQWIYVRTCACGAYVHVHEDIGYLFHTCRGWPQPVLLRKMDEDVLDLKLQQWDPKVCQYNNIYMYMYIVSFSAL